MKSMLRFVSRTAFASLLALCFAPAQAAIDLVGDDTDLFMVNPDIPTQVPNVLIVLDNSANWARQSQHWPTIVDQACTDAGITGNQQGDAEVCAIYKVIGNLTEQVNVGLMMFNDNTKGAYVRFPMKPMNDVNRPLLQDALKVIDTEDEEDKTAQDANYESPMNDAFRYFNSFATFGGTGAAALRAHDGGYVPSSNKTVFTLPQDPNNLCGNDYIIFIGNGFPKTSALSPAIDSAAALLNDPKVVVNKTVLQNTGSNADIWTRFMFQYGVKVSEGVYRSISTYTLDVCKDACEANQATLLKSMANVSNGGYYKTSDLAQIEAALKEIFQKVQAVNSVFAATTLPVSINVRGTNLNQVYIGVFRPDGNQSPRWLGNLKQYKLGVKDAETGQLELQDANSNAAVNLKSGFIFNTATSIWTQDSTFWSFRTPFEPTDVGEESDEPDGDQVEKGGAAQKIRQVYDFPDATAAQTRNLYTCTGTCNSGSQLKDYPFNSANAAITAQQLGTLVAKSVTSLTASGTTATATVASGNTFVAGDSVVISGAVPSLYNGTFTVLGTPAPTATTFSYTVSPAPDATRAYATQPGYTLVPGTDKVTVAGAMPVEYNVTEGNVEAVVGNVNQFAYPITGSPSTAAIGYTVTGHRRIADGNLVWSSTTFEVTATLPNHGYSTGDVVTISGADQGEFNVPGGFSSGFITRIDDHTFTYSPSAFPAGATVQSAVATTADPNTGSNPFIWNAGDRVRVTNGGSSSFNTATSPAPGGANITDVSGNTFTYATSGEVNGSAGSGFTAERISVTDTNTWTLSGASVTAGPSVTLTLSNMVNLVPGQLAHPFVAGDVITVNNLICRRSNGNVIACHSGTTAGATSFTATVTAANNSGVTVTFGDVSNQVASFTINTPATVKWAASSASPTFSSAISILTLDAGEATVTATGTIFATKTGDLTMKVTSISSGAVATGTITAALASSGDPAERDKLIEWVRGKDNRNDENMNGDATDIRAGVHGDVLHSRPAVVNYNRNGDENDVFVFYGANDGLLHAIKGGGLGTGGGKEQWAFIPTEFFGKYKRLREQTPSISSLTPRDYFFDGPMGVYTLDANKDGKLLATDGDKVYLFVGMRRGGRMVYALDISNPADPKFMWKRGCREAKGNGTAAGSGGCDVGFTEMGQTWSEPKLGYLRKWPDTLAVMFAAGYDAPVEDPQACFVTGWDAAGVTHKTGVVPPIPMNASTCPPAGGSTTTTARTMGRGIYILNALTGDILWRAGPEGSASRQMASMTYAMPGDLAVLRNRNNTANRATDIGFENVPVGYLDRIYASDTGGTVWRFDVSDASGASGEAPSYVITKLASIAVGPQGGSHAARDYRKFLFSPDVVYASDANGAFDAVLLGSGDREHPFDMVVQNRFYMFKDPNVGSLTELEVPLSSQPTPPAGVIVDTTTSTDLFDVTNNCLQDEANCASGQTQTSAQSDLLAARGWKLGYAFAGEKTVATATTAAGTVIFNTHEPKDDGVTNTEGVCTSALGTARQYGINFLDATATNIFDLPSQYVGPDGRNAVFVGGGYLPTPVPVVVQIDGKYYQTVVAGVQTTNPGGLKLQSRIRTYWNRKVD